MYIIFAGFLCVSLNSLPQARPTEVRLNAFRNVGRLMGLCLLQNELCPLFLNRHVIKYILSRYLPIYPSLILLDFDLSSCIIRPVKFHDLAFFDPVIYESLRQLVVDAEKPGSDNATALQVTKIEEAICGTLKCLFSNRHWT